MKACIVVHEDLDTLHIFAMSLRNLSLNNILQRNCTCRRTSTQKQTSFTLNFSENQFTAVLKICISYRKEIVEHLLTKEEKQWCRWFYSLSQRILICLDSGLDITSESRASAVSGHDTAAWKSLEAVLSKCPAAAKEALASAVEIFKACRGRSSDSALILSFLLCTTTSASLDYTKLYSNQSLKSYRLQYILHY